MNLCTCSVAYQYYIITDKGIIIHLCRLDYMHLIFSALPEHHRSFMTLPPCIVRPDKLWSGKQVLSTLLLNIVPEGQQKLNLTSRAKIAVKVCKCYGHAWFMTFAYVLCVHMNFVYDLCVSPLCLYDLCVCHLFSYDLCVCHLFSYDLYGCLLFTVTCSHLL